MFHLHVAITRQLGPHTVCKSVHTGTSIRIGMGFWQVDTRLGLELKHRFTFVCTMWVFDGNKSSLN